MRHKLLLLLFILSGFISFSSGNGEAVFQDLSENISQHPENPPYQYGPNALVVRLYTIANLNNNGSPHDGVLIHFGDNYNNGYDIMDALKPRNFNENLGRKLGERLLSIEYRKLPLPGEQLELYSDNYRSTAYALKILLDGLEMVDIYIDDAYTGTSSLVTQNSVVPFNVVNQTGHPSRASNRFSIRFALKPNTFIYQNNTWEPSHPSGIASSADNVFIINGTTSFPAETTVNRLDILANASLDVEDVLNLHGDMNIEGNLTFKSTATKNGELGTVGPSSTITGLATVERYFQSRRAYRMVSSPVYTSTSIRQNWQEDATNRSDNPAPGYGTHITGTTVDGTNGFDATQTGNSSMWTVDIAAQQFVPIANTNTKTLAAGDSYLMYIRGDRSINLDSNTSEGHTTLRAKGILHIGDKLEEFYTTTTGTFAMFGNPYQSAVNVNTLFSNSVNINPNHYYIYDPSNGAQGGYVTVMLPQGTNGQGSPANHFLQAGQAAQFATDTPGSSFVIFTESAKAPGNHATTNASGNAFEIENSINVLLYTRRNMEAGERPHDGFLLLFGEGYGNDINQLDAIKPMNFEENLAIDNNATYLSIEKREMPVPAEIYRFHTSGYTESEYVLKINMDGLQGVDLYLDDIYTGASMLLASGENFYNFVIDNNEESRATDRFLIRTESSLSITDHIFEGVRLFPNPIHDDTFFIHAPHLIGKQVQVLITDLAGRRVHKQIMQTPSAKLTVNPENQLPSGAYIVTLEFEGEKQSLRLIKN
ncbi:MAG TPA: T9SS type A sorting domain-containing protein [Flavobacteriaceae bacterium]|nr:T9SS type A sorting domain-containing protein [Flavobacteriaceae bacterium]